MKRAITVVFVAAVLGCVLAQESPAQSCKIVSSFPGPGYVCLSAAYTPTPVGAVCPVYFGSGLADCGAPGGCMCAPYKTAQPPQPRCEHCQRPQGGHPIDLATGNTFISQTDISLPGLGGGLSLTRTWNSIPSSVYASGPHMFGLGWQSNYEDRLVYQTSDGFLTEESGAEDETAFGWNGPGSAGVNTYSVVAPFNRVATVTQNVDNNKNPLNFTLVSMDGEKRVYDPTTGSLLSITDRNRNTTLLTYDSSLRLVTVTDPASRHLNFTYLSSTGNLVATVTSDVGISLSYAYDTNGRLIKVTKPDNTTISFQYDGNNKITAVLDNDGKVLESHTYDAAGHGLTSSQANGVDSFTVTYP